VSNVGDMSTGSDVSDVGGMRDVRGSVRELRIYPVKGEPAVELDSVSISPEGLAGDRRKGAPVHLVSAQAIERAGQDAPRANLLLDLPDDDERDWIGQDIQIGSARMTVVRAPRHCLGVYAEVVSPGRVNLGDSVRPPG
jgi:uncharacterized protein YcbX